MDLRLRLRLGRSNGIHPPSTWHTTPVRIHGLSLPVAPPVGLGGKHAKRQAGQAPSWQGVAPRPPQAPRQNGVRCGALPPGAGLPHACGQRNTRESERSEQACHKSAYFA